MGGTSKLVDRLEVSGYCCRRPNPDDRRPSIIELTPTARRMLAEATAALESRLGAALPVHELDQFGMALTTLRSAGQYPEAPERTP